MNYYELAKNMTDKDRDFVTQSLMECGFETRWRYVEPGCHQLMTEASRDEVKRVGLEKWLRIASLSCYQQLESNFRNDL